VSRLKAAEGGYEDESRRSERDKLGHNWVIQSVPERLSRAWLASETRSWLRAGGLEDWRDGQDGQIMAESKARREVNIRFEAVISCCR
jgi:hypothetical protein